MPTEIDYINKSLKNLYGSHLDGRPWFRVVFSTEQIEKRIGKFSEFYGSIFVREYVGMAEVPKYPGPQFKDRWILEKLMFITNPELWADTEKGVYEPVWVFRGKGDTYQKPTWKAVQFTVGMIFMPKQTLSQSDLDKLEDQTLEKEIADNLGLLDDKYGGSIAAGLHQRETIVNPLEKSK